jgi:hypothetical protein
MVSKDTWGSLGRFTPRSEAPLKGILGFDPALACIPDCRLFPQDFVVVSGNLSGHNI